MSKQYHIIINGQQAGPFAVEDLIINGVTVDTLVWTPGMTNWEKAGAVAELAPIFKPATPEPPMTPPSSGAFPPSPQQTSHKYFVIINNAQQGPYEPQQLATVGVNANTMVWRDGMTDWQPASSLPELAPWISGNFNQNNFGNNNVANHGFNNGYQNNGYQAGYNSGIPSPSVHTNWMPWAITATILGFLFSCIGMIFGIVAINKARTANAFFAIGDDYNGEEANRSARTMTIVALVIAGIGLIVSIAFIGESL